MADSLMILFAVVLIMCCGTHASLDVYNHRYRAGDPVPFYANIVGPFNNPSETYAYYDLPFCSPDYVKKKKETFSEVLTGYRLVDAPYKLDFLVEKDDEVWCRKKLTKEEVSQFRRAVARDYYIQMYYDDLPIWSFIGRVEHHGQGVSNDQKYVIFEHMHYKIFYNRDNIIEIQARIDPKFLVDATKDVEVNVEFRYTVKWIKTSTTFQKRMEKYSNNLTTHHLGTRWFSITNALVPVLILIGCLLVFYLTVLQKDIKEYAHDEELVDSREETGWKNIHSDVFRYPHHKSLFAAALGCGTQLFALWYNAGTFFAPCVCSMIFILILGVLGVFYPYNRGLLLTALVIIYAITSAVSGYTAVSFYCQLEGTNWTRNLLLTGLLFCGPLLLMFCFLNSVAVAYGVTIALPLTRMLVILIMYTVLALPLLLLGGILGKNIKFEFDAPCRTSECPRVIPPLCWYRGTLPQMTLAGILPFNVICREFYYIFCSIWGHRIYTIYGILVIVVISLLIATAFMSVALTYFQLAAEDHTWWWRSFLCGGSTGLFIYGYCFYYYFTKSDMDGFMQISHFFGYMAIICYGIFLMLGTVGFYASLLFVRYIYGSIKCD